MNGNTNLNQFTRNVDSRVCDNYVICIIFWKQENTVMPGYRRAGNVSKPLLLPVNPSITDYTMTVDIDSQITFVFVII